MSVVVDINIHPVCEEIFLMLAQQKRGRGARKTLPAALGHNLCVCDLLKLLLTTLSFQAYAKIPKVGKRQNIA